MKKLTKKEAETFLELARRIFETENLLEAVVFYRSPVDRNEIRIKREYVSCVKIVSKVPVKSRKEKRR